MTIVNMQLCKSPSEINKAIASNCDISKSSSYKEGWEGLYSAEQIISIIYNPNSGEYNVFWREKI